MSAKLIHDISKIFMFVHMSLRVQALIHTLMCFYFAKLGKQLFTQLTPRHGIILFILLIVPILLFFILFDRDGTDVVSHEFEMQE